MKLFETMKFPITVYRSKYNKSKAFLCSNNWTEERKNSIFNTTSEKSQSQQFNKTVKRIYEMNSIFEWYTCDAIVFFFWNSRYYRLIFDVMCFINFMTNKYVILNISLNYLFSVILCLLCFSILVLSCSCVGDRLGS